MNKAHVPNHNKALSLSIFIHIISWILFFIFPLLMISWSGSMRWDEYLRHLAIPVSFFLVFYTNYLFLVPRYLFRRQHSLYILLNILLITSIVLFLHLAYFPHIWNDYVKECSEQKVQEIMHRPPMWIFACKDFISLIFIAGLGAAIRMSSQWQQAETARREAEQNRMAAELSNLRNQLNPHFLLNTLNNIYALITFDTNKAQQAVQELSKLLRHMLYDTLETFVPLYKELDFICNYIELMRIRLSQDVHITIDIQVPENSQTPIAPLIFISLIENAFKHGISPTETSFINISISEKNGNVVCKILNSNHPKNQSDKSGSGIGLEQVKKRLELLYPKRYNWTKGTSRDKKIYSSLLSIQTDSKK